MRTFKFFDSDISGQDEYDIIGDEYESLLRTCFKYCTSVSVIISPDYVDNIQRWSKHRIPVTHNVQITYRHYGPISPDNPNLIGDYEIRYYNLSPEIQEMILEHTDSIFKWICGWGYNNPNDIAFYRKDGSVLFSSLIHEGECTLFLRDGENLESIVSQHKWIEI